MLFKKKTTSSSQPFLSVYSSTGTLYEGPLKDLPLRESVVIEKSIRFFDDPEPCFIHRSAVQARLTAEIQQELETLENDAPGTLLPAYADLTGVERCHLSFPH